MDNWRILGKVSEVGEAKVYAQNLWWEFQRRSNWMARFLRVFACAALYFVFCFAIIKILGPPCSPARGSLSRRADIFIMYFAASANIFVTFWVLDAAYLNNRLIRYLVVTNTHYPTDAFNRFNEWHLNPTNLTEFLDIRFIAKRTGGVGRIIYYPFIIFILLLVARSSLFADWSWPPGLIIVLVLGLVLAIGGAVLLRMAAEEAREVASKGLANRIAEILADKEEKDENAKEDRIKKLREIAKRVEEEKEGAFSLLYKHPYLSALLVPGGSLGIGALIDAVAKLLT